MTEKGSVAGQKEPKQSCVTEFVTISILGSVQEGGTIGFVEDLKRAEADPEVEFTLCFEQVLEMGPESSAALGTLGSQNFRLRLESIPALRFSKCITDFPWFSACRCQIMGLASPHHPHKSISYNKSHFIYVRMS